MKTSEREKFLNADYKQCDIIELCWIHAKCLKEEEYDICSKIVSDLKDRVLADYDRQLLKRYLKAPDSDYKYMNELNGLLENLK